VRGGLRGAESGDGELPPPLPRLHPNLSRIQAQRECPPPMPLPLPGRHARPVSSASIPAVIHYGYGWTPASLRPQIR
jgi:hypothetical protein